MDEYRRASPEIRAQVEAECGGEATPDDIELARIISNMAVDVTRGDKIEAKNYIDQIAARSTSLVRLMARVGMTIAKAENSTKS